MEPGAVLAGGSSRNTSFATLERLTGGDTDLSEVLLAIRNVFVEEFGFDRSGLFWYDAITETMHGAWGTDPNGNLEDSSHVEFPYDGLERDTWDALPSGGVAYVLRHYCEDEERTGMPPEMAKVRDHATIIFGVGKELVGYVAFDNLLTHRPITEADVKDLLPFARQAAFVILNAKLRADREASAKRRQRISEISLAITSNQDVESVYKLVRNAILEIGFVDRASVWTFNNGTAYGTWGTDLEGTITDEHNVCFKYDPLSPDFKTIFESSNAFSISSIVVEGPNGERWTDVPHAVIPLRFGADPIGFVAVDTVFTRRVITQAMLKSVLPITDQAAVAALNIRLRTERESIIRDQKRLLEIAIAITADHEVDVVFKMVRDAVLETGWVDRAGVWIVEGDLVRGTWGTDSAGNLTDEHGESYRIPAKSSRFERLIDEGTRYLIEPIPSETASDGSQRLNVPRAFIPLRAGLDLVGILSIDTLLTMRPIASEQLDLILPLANFAAIVVQKRRLYMAANNELERRREMEAILIGQTQELTAARDAAQEGNKVKSEFLANISHELRTPLNGLLGMNSLLIETDLDSRQRAYALAERESAGALHACIDKILDFSRLNADEVRIVVAPFDLRATLSALAEEISEHVNRATVSVSCSIADELPNTVIGDEAHIRQVLSNILDNAVRFTSEGEIRIEARCLTGGGDSLKLRLLVSDTGKGIPKHLQSTVFESFTQGDGSSTREFGGTGLGLTIAKRLVELMGGSIGLESTPGKGTTVSLDLEMGNEKLLDSSEGKAMVATASEMKIRVLLAEDNPINTMVAVEQLERWGCSYVTVENGLEAVAAISGQDFDVVLMDVSMPQMDGLEATRQIRNKEEHAGKHTTIIAVTAHAMEGDRERCIEAGMDDYVAKPVDFRALHDKLASLRRSA